MSPPITRRPSACERLATSALLAAVLATPALGQSQWTDLGCDLPGTSGSPVLGGTGTLDPGSPGSLELDGAASNALAMLFLALEDNPVSFKGGVLKPVPFFDLPVLVTSGSGEIDLPFLWPTDLPEGFPFYTQYAVQDGGAVKGVALSNALRGVTPGPALIDSISSTNLNPQDAFSITGVNLGDDPDDLLLLIQDEVGATVGFTRTESVSGNTVSTRLGYAVPGSTGGKLAVSRDEGAIVPPQTSPAGVTFPEGGSWVVNINPAGFAVLDQELDLFAPSGSDSDSSYQASLNHYQYIQSTIDGNGWIEIEMPEGDCPADTVLNFQIVAQTTDGSLAFSYWVELETTVDLDALTCATILSQELSLAVFDFLGVLLTCIPVQQGSDVYLRILPPPTKQWSEYSMAFFSICFPAVSCAQSSNSATFSSAVELLMPTSTPDDAAFTVYADGLTDQANYDWAWATEIMVAGPTTPLEVADAAVAALQASFDDNGSTATAETVVIGPNVLIRVNAPTSEIYEWAYLSLDLCELQ